MAGAGVLELGGGDGGVGLRGGRERGSEVRSFLHGVEDRVANFFAEHFAERAGTEEFAERALGLDLADFGIEAQLRVVLLDGGRQADGNDGVAGDEALGLLLTESLHTGKTFVGELNRCEGGGGGGGGRSLLNRDALTAAVVFVELRAQERCEIFLQAGEVGGELQAERLGGGSLGQHRDRGGRDDVGLLVLEGEGDFLRRDFERSILCGENYRQSRKQRKRKQQRARASNSGSPQIAKGIVCADATRYRFPLGE